jgi:hypothetical protein
MTTAMSQKPLFRRIIESGIDQSIARSIGLNFADAINGLSVLLTNYNLFQNAQNKGHFTPDLVQGYLVSIKLASKEITKLSVVEFSLTGHSHLVSSEEVLPWATTAEFVMEALVDVREELVEWLCSELPDISPEIEFQNIIAETIIHIDKVNGICRELSDRRSLFMTKPIDLPDRPTIGDISKDKPWSI